MKNNINLSFLFLSFSLLLLFSCKGKETVTPEEPDTPAPQMGSITLNNDTRKYPLSSIGDTYDYYSAFSTAIPTSGASYKVVHLMIKDFQKKYIGNIAALKDAGILTIKFKFPINTVFTETPKDFTIQHNSRDYGTAGIGFEMLIQTPDYKTLGWYLAVTGQKVSISQKGDFVTVSIPYLKTYEYTSKANITITKTTIVTN